MQIKYLSYSQVRTYLDDPARYFTEYVLGMRPEPSPALKFGKILHGALSGEIKNPLDELRSNGFAADASRILTAAISQFGMTSMTKNMRAEAKIKCNDICELLGYVDYLNDIDGTFLELKTGNAWIDGQSRPWSQQIVDQDRQISFYSHMIRKITGKMPKQAILCSVNIKVGKDYSVSGDGSWRYFKTKRKVSDLKEIKKLIEYAYTGITNEVWEKQLL